MVVYQMEDHPLRSVQKEIKNKEEEISKYQNDIEMISERLPMIDEQLEELMNRNNEKAKELGFRQQKLRELQKQYEEAAKKVHEDFVEVKQNGESDLRKKVIDQISSLIAHGDSEDNEFFDGDARKYYDLSPMTKFHSARVKLAYTKEATIYSDEEMQFEFAFFRVTPQTTLGDIRAAAADYWCRSGFFAPKTLFVLLDSSLSHLLDDQKVLERNKGNSEPEEYWVVPKKMYDDNSHLSELSKYDDLEAEKKNLKDKELKEGKHTNNLEDIYRVFPMLKRYFPSLEGSHGKNSESSSSKNTSFCTLIFLTILNILSVYIIFSQRDITTEFWLQEGVRQYLSINTKGGFSFKDIKTVENLNSYVTDVLGAAFFIDSASGESSLCGKMQFVGPLRFRHVRSKSIDCERAEFQCHSSEESDILKEDTGGMSYLPSSDGAEIRGEFGVYEPGGFIQDYTSCGLTNAEFSSEYEKIAVDWNDPAVRAYFITTNIYSPDYDLWVYVNLMVEVSVNGLAYPSEKKVAAFQPNLFDRNSFALGATVLRDLCTLYLLWIYIALIMEKRGEKRNFKYILSFLGIVDVLMMSSVATSRVISFLITENEEEIFSSGDFPEFRFVVSLYTLYHLMNCVSFMMILIRTVLFFGVVNQIDLLLATITKAGKNMLSFLIILCTVLSSYALMAQSIWGTYSSLYRSFTLSFLSLLLINIGHGDFQEMFETDLTWSVIFFTVYFFTVIFFLLAAFMGIYMDAYRVVRLVNGSTTQLYDRALLRAWFRAPYEFVKGKLKSWFSKCQSYAASKDAEASDSEEED